MTEVISERVRQQLPIGKYTRWAEQCSSESLEVLLWALGVFGAEHDAARRAMGTSPKPTFAPHTMAEVRMRYALEDLAAVHAGADFEMDPGERSAFSGESGSAFADHFSERLSSGDTFLAWAARLNERQLWTLLWQVGEYGVRINSSRGAEGEDYPPPAFDVSSSSENLMRNALRIVAMVHRGKTIDLRDARSRVLEDKA